jgi:hypothetical protein
MMTNKVVLVILLALSTQIPSFAQPQDNFFPHHVGDFWEYFVLNGVGNDTMQVWVTLDSTDQNGITYVQHHLQVINPTGPPLNNPWYDHYRIDTANQVYAGDQYFVRRLQYKLNAGIGEIWVADTFEGWYNIARVKEIYIDTLYGNPKTFKEIWYYGTQDTSDTTVWLWQYTELLAEGFGVVFRGWGDLGYNLYLRGAIISGHLFGDTTIVSAHESDKVNLPYLVHLFQNYPNPYNPLTTIFYTLPETRYVRLSVFDLLGQEVATLVNGVQEAGFKSVNFDAGNLPSGVYFYRLTAGKFSDVKKMLLVR